MRNVFALVLGLAGLVAADACRADPITLQCKIVSGAKTTYGKADQVMIDPENSTVELRVARSMGTSDQELWDFTTQTKAGIDDRFTVKSFVPSLDANPVDGPIYGGGVRAGSGQAFQLVKGVLSWVSMYEGKTDTMSWRCSR